MKEWNALKTKQLLTLLVVFCVMLTTSPVLAQTDNPPLQKTETPSAETRQAEPDQEEPKMSVLPPGYSPPPASEKDFSASRSSANRAISEVDSFDIGVTSDVVEQHSDVAHGGNVWAIAYEEDNEIMVMSIIDYGGWYNSYVDRVSNNYNQSYSPAIAYEPSTGLFVVTWMYDFDDDGTDYDILARAVDPYSGTVGDITVISEELIKEMYPDIACNINDSSCLIVFEYDDGGGTIDIYGRYMDISSSGVSSSSPADFEITNLSNTSKGPHIAWSDYGGSYMTVYTWTNSGGEAFPVHSVLYDTWQGTGSASIMTDEYYSVYTGIEDPWYPNGYDKYASGVAYDFCSEKFVITYIYDYYGNGTDYDVMASATNSNGLSLSGPYYIAASGAQESSADISFITDPVPSNANAAPCKLVTTYTRSGHYTGDDGIITTEIEGNCSYSSPSYSTSLTSAHLLVEEPSPIFGSGVYAPAISGGNDTEFFISYDYMTGGMVYQYSVLGKLFRADIHNFLPLIVR